MINSRTIKKVEKGKLSERIGRKVLGLKHGHCENGHCEASSSVIARSEATKQYRITLNHAMIAKLPILFFGELFNRSINELIGRSVDWS